MIIDKAQCEASDPRYSMWVSASAGTGKTKVLINRFLRLLLDGTEWHKILCVTFTNIAADEMKHRIHYEITKWSKSSEIELKHILYLLLGEYPTKEQIQKAKSLFKEYLDTPHEIHIKTIHSFCHYLLTKYYDKQINIIDNVSLQQIIHAIKEKIINYTNHSIIFTIKNIHESQVNKLIQEIINREIDFIKLFKRFGKVDHYEKYLKKIFNINHQITKQDAINNLRLYLTDNFDRIPEKIKYQIHNFLNNLSNFDEILKIFLIQDGNKRKGISSSISDIQELVFNTHNLINSLGIIHYSKNLFQTAQIIIDLYNRFKYENDFLSYEDLINNSYDILNTNQYDIDIDHILVDESQDTSNSQWKIIKEIIRKFSHKNTVFVVGDDKQSIYSFQGADLNLYLEAQSFIKKNIKGDYKFIKLQSSYRSTQVILDAVYDIFNYIKLHHKIIYDGHLKGTKKSQRTKIEIWPIVVSKSKQDLFWPTQDIEKTNNAYDTLAYNITKYIKNDINQNNKQPRDFLILVRQRNDFIDSLIQELKNNSIPTSGLDRINIFNHISVMDLLSAAKFAMLPIDNLNLASLLKSPLIKLSEQELHALCNMPGSLWNNISDNNKYSDIHKILCNIKNLYHKNGIFNFFYKICNGLCSKNDFINFNGSESNEVINEFLHFAFQFENNQSSSINDFIYWCENSNIEIKKNITNINEVKIMTVHGAKGFQGNTVILADTVHLPKLSDKLLYTLDGIILWGNNKYNNEKYEFYKREIVLNQYHEYIRLLYVAVTRAEKELIICGYSSQDNISEKCWYHIIKNALKDKLIKTSIPKYMQYDERDVIYTTKEYNKYPIKENNIIKTKQKISLNYPNNNTSHLVQNYHLNLSPFHANTLHYGKIIHKILEDIIDTKDLTLYLSHPLLDELTNEEYKKAISQFQNIIQNKEFIKLFGYNLQTEVNIGNYENEEFKIYRIDLLAISDNEIIIIDYKTDCFANENYKIPQNYSDQLYLYKTLIQKIYTKQKIITKIFSITKNKFIFLQ